MKKNFLAEYVSKRLFLVRKDLVKFRKKQKQARIHNLRVNIKQIRAIFFLLDTISAGQRYPKKVFKKLFDDAGLVRESHINLGLAKNFQYSGTVIGELKESKRNLSAQFLAKTPRYLSSLDLQEKKIALPGQLPRKKDLIIYFGRQIRKARTYLKNTEDKKNMHLFRKKVKEIMYIYAALPAKMKNWVGLNEKYLNNLQIKAGKWHDTFAAISFFENTVNGPDVKLAALKAQEEKRSKALLKYSKNFETNVFK